MGHSLGKKNKVAQNEKRKKKYIRGKGFGIPKIWHILKRFAGAKTLANTSYF